MVKWAQHEFGINFKIKWIVSPSLFIVQFTIDKMIYSPFLKRFCCLGSRRIRFPVWFLTSCSPTEPSSMALHYLLCITSCLPRKLPEVSHKVPIYLNLLCITLLVMESSCSVPPGTNLHNFLYRGKGCRGAMILAKITSERGDNGGRLGDVTEAGRPVLRGL